MSRNTDLTAFALPDLTYNFEAAESVAGACNVARDRIASQARSRAALITAAMIDFSGRFAHVFSLNASTAQADCEELLVRLAEITRAIRLLSDAAREENTRRTNARAWRDRVIARRTNPLDTAWDSVFGEEPPPSAGKVVAPRLVQADYTPPLRAAVRGMDGSVSSARPANLRAFASGSASANDELRALPGTIQQAITAFTEDCDFGTLDISSVLSGFRRWLSANDDDVLWANTVAAAFEAAGAGGQTIALSDDSLAAALQAAGQNSLRSDLDFGAPEYFGVVPTNGFAADPVNTATGNFIEAERDLSFAGSAADLSFERTYNSFDRDGGVFGRGWTSPLDMRLVVLADHVLFVKDDGRRIQFPTRGTEPARAVSENLWIAAEPSHLPPSNEAPAGASRLVVRDNAGAWWEFATDGVWLSSGAGDRVVLSTERDRDGQVVRLRHHRGRFIDFEYADGLVRSATSRDGRRVTYEYGVGGALISSNAPDGGRSYAWDDAGRIERVTAADGVVECENTYDEHGRVIRQTTPHGRVIRFAYLQGGVTSVSDEDGANSNTWIADRRGRVVGIVDADGQRQSMSYDAHGNLVASTTRAGETSVHAYDHRGRLVRSVEVDGTDTTVIYDDLDRLTRFERSGQVVSYEYPDESESAPSTVSDGRGARYELTWLDGLLVRVQDHRGVFLVYGYDSCGDLVSVSDALGQQTTFARDEVGRIIESTTPLGHRTRFEFDRAGTPVSREDPDNAVWRVEREPAGKVAALIDPLGSRTTFTHGSHGEIETVTDPLGRRTTLHHDHSGNLSEIVTPDGSRWALLHDALSRLREVTDPAGGQWLREYDLVGRLAARVDPTGVRLVAVTPDVQEPHDTSLQTPDHAVDPAGRGIAAISSLGDETSVECDALGRPTSWMDPRGGRSSLQYDADSRVVEHRDPTGAVSTFGYDACGRVTVARVPGVGTTKYEYDLAGRLTGVEDPRNGRRVFAYDGGGQMTSAVSGLGITTVWRYDDNGRPTQSESGTGGRRQVGYTALGDVSSTADPLGRITESAWDAARRLTSRTTPDGETTAWKYDASGLLSETWQRDQLAVRVTRDDMARTLNVEDFTHPDGAPTVHRLEYDAADRLLRRTTTRGGKEANTEWEYDTNGHCTAVTTPDGGRTAYDRGPAGVLRGVRCAGFEDAVLDHDDAGRLTHGRAGAVDQEWTYEDGFVVGHTDHRRTTTVTRDRRGRVVAVHPSDEDVLFFDYDEGSQLVGTRVGVTIESWAYDEAGRIVAEANASGRRTYSYDRAGQLLRVEHPGDQPSNVRFVYDGQGRRIRAASETGSATYAWDPHGRLRRVVHEHNGKRETTTLWVNALGELAEINGIELCWDVAMPVPALLSVAGVRVLTAPGLIGVGGDWESTGWRRARCMRDGDPWTASTASVSSRLPDGITLSATGGLIVAGLEFMGARAYDPITRSFLSPDPLPPITGAAWAENPYSFAGNDPVNQTDPSGLRPITDEELAAYGISRQGFFGITRRLSNKSAHSVDGDLHYSQAMSWLLGMSLLDWRLLSPGDVLSALFPFPALRPVVGNLTDSYVASLLNSSQGQLLFGWATGLSPRTLLHGPENQMTQVIRQEFSQQQREWAVKGLRDGTSDWQEKLGYSAGDPVLSNPAFIRDVGTILTWPSANNHDRTLLTLGSYEVDARLVQDNGDGTAVIEYTAVNETTLGSLLRLPWFDYDALNAAAGDEGPLSRVTEKFSWKETVEW